MLSLARNIHTIFSSKLKAESGKNITVQCTLCFPAVKILSLSKFNEAFTGKTNTANVYTDIQLAKVKVG